MTMSFPSTAATLTRVGQQSPTNHHQQQSLRGTAGATTTTTNTNKLVGTALAIFEQNNAAAARENVRRSFGTNSPKPEAIRPSGRTMRPPPALQHQQSMPNASSFQPDVWSSSCSSLEDRAPNT